MGPLGRLGSSGAEAPAEAGQGAVGQASRGGEKRQSGEAAGTEWGQMRCCQGLRRSSSEGRGLAQHGLALPRPSWEPLSLRVRGVGKEGGHMFSRPPSE